MRKRLDARKQSALSDFTRWLAAADHKSLTAMIPTDGLKLAAISADAPATVGPDKT